MVRAQHFYCWGPGFNPWSGNQDPASSVPWQKTNKGLEKKRFLSQALMTLGGLSLGSIPHTEQWVWLLPAPAQHHDCLSPEWTRRCSLTQGWVQWVCLVFSLLSSTCYAPCGGLCSRARGSCLLKLVNCKPQKFSVFGEQKPR